MVKVKKQKKKTQKQQHEDMLRNMFVTLGVIVILVLAFYFIANSVSNFNYKGVDFTIVKEEKLIFYQTSLPVTYQGQDTEYNFYLRNDPRKLDEIPFEGQVEFIPFVVLNSTEDYTCGGYGVIAMANLVNLYTLMGSKVIQDANATCDDQSNYLFLRLQPGNETSIEQFDTACYNLNINNCEILEVTEKLMVESFIKLNDALNESTTFPSSE